MKKFISIISILTVVIFTNSCRSQDEDLGTETFNKEQRSNIFRKTTDSIETDSVKTVISTMPTDPPPKNGHQW